MKLKRKIGYAAKIPNGYLPVRRSPVNLEVECWLWPLALPVVLAYACSPALKSAYFPFVDWLDTMEEARFKRKTRAEDGYHMIEEDPFRTNQYICTKTNQRFYKYNHHDDNCTQ